MSNVPAGQPEIKQLSADNLYWELVETARRQSLEEKLLAGPGLFDLACEFTRCGIRMQFPDADEARVNAIMEARLALGRSLVHQ